MKNFTRDNFLYTREHLSREEIHIYLEEIVPDEIAHPIESHLLECAMCRNSVEYIRENGFEMLDEIGNSVSEKVRKRIEAGENKEFTEAETPLQSAETPILDPTSPRPPARPERPNPAAPTRRKRFISYSLAATVALLCVVAYFVFFNNSEDFRSTMDQHFAEQTEPLALIKNTAGPSDDFGKALEAYDAGEFELALQLMTLILPTDTLHYRASRAYIADCNLRSGHFEEAMKGFETFRKNNPNNRWYSEVSWPLARVYYRLGKYSELELLLIKMGEDELTPNRKHAQQVLKDFQVFKKKGLIPQ